MSPLAQCRRFVCSNCRRSVGAWDDGNPYYLDEIGRKRYAYHPDHERLALCIGNDSPHICLDCAKQFKVDSRQPRTVCPRCHSRQIVDTCVLGGRRCPYCHSGVFAEDSDFHCMS